MTAVQYPGKADKKSQCIKCTSTTDQKTSSLILSDKTYDMAEDTIALTEHTTGEDPFNEDEVR